MRQRRSPSSPNPAWGSTKPWRISQGSSDRFLAPHPNEVTDIIPIDELAGLDGLDFGDSAAFDSFDSFDGEAFDNAGFDGFDSEAFDNEAQVLDAPELDDLHNTDNLTALRLTLPADYLDPYSYHRRPTALAGLPPQRGRHRRQPVSAVRSRVMAAAMAAGAVAAAAHAATQPSGTASAQAVPSAADAAPGAGTVVSSSGGMQMVTVKAAANVVMHNEELAKGVAYAQERAEREARLQQPLFVMPTRGIFTSNFGYRWGVLHGGVDIANAIGTPILAASDGVVIEAGSSAGYGMLVKLRHSDGTVTLYGHVNSTMVSVGERVMAGDQIATMGNRGYSTGPHLHFEVLLGGTTRVDPTPWLAQRGVNLGA